MNLSLILVEDAGGLSLGLRQFAAVDAEFHGLFIEECSRNL